MINNLQNLKIVIVVEELTQLGGAERLLDYYLELFPKAPVFTLIFNTQKTLRKYEKFDIRSSFIQKMPWGIKRYKWYLPLMPLAIESFNLKNYDIVLSITSALVKGVKTTSTSLHVCYCNTPTRWLWTDKESYLKTAPIPFFVRPLMPLVINWLKRWDLKAAKKPDFIIANSKNVQSRISKYYHRKSDIISVPVDAQKFVPKKIIGKYYLLVSRIEPYKKVDLVIDAFKKLKLPLLVVGSGTQLEKYKVGLPKNIKFIGRVSDEKLVKIYQDSIATIFPQEEDAGIVPLESMACGRPVIAFGRGGALETIIDGKTGIFFEKQTTKDLINAIKKFQKIKFNSVVIRNQALKFDKELFKQKILEYIISKQSKKGTKWN